MITTKERAFLLLPKALPTSSHYHNLRHVLKPAAWKKLRFQVLEAANYQCELCLAKPKRLEVHELWRFKPQEKIQYLANLVSLCQKCHALQHVLLLKLLADRGVKNDQLVIDHYNKLTKSHLNFHQFYALANQVQQKLEQEWTIVINPQLIDF